MKVFSDIAPTREKERLIFMIKSRFFLGSVKGVDPRVLDQILLNPEGVRILTGLLWRLVEKEELDVVGCTESAVLPVVGTLVLTSRFLKVNLKGALVGKRGIRGDISKKDRVFLIGSMVGDGKAIFDSIRVVEERKAKVVRVVCILDDEEETPLRETLEKNYRLSSLVKLSELEVL